MNQQYFPQHGQTMRPLQGVLPGTASRPPQGMTASSLGGPSPVMPTGTASRPPQVVSGNALTSDSFFGDDVFSATHTATKQEPSLPTYSATSGIQAPIKSGSLDSLLKAVNTPTSSSIVSGSSGAQARGPVKSSSLNSLQSAFTMQPLGGQPQQTQSLQSSGPQVSASSSASLVSPGISAGVGKSSENTQLSWPKMKPDRHSEVQ
ncbi:hypothetical protein OIU77_026232 [Salix suchowensis]|uniref:Uncharacterized protein n=1 Tax=Salix suchowensis TaxID=1278906 RepID=A0ABQ9BYX2_9ROSI|nr:hypothetical protein OIU77_026232 [Salix suchowensis]